MLGIYLLSFILPVIVNQCKHWGRLICGAICSIFLTPTYFNLLTIYSIANLHDVSWGTRGSDDTLGNFKSKLQSFRAWWFVVWLFINVIYAYLIILFNNNSDPNNKVGGIGNQFVKFLAIVLTLLLLVKLIFGVCYKIHYDMCRKRQIRKVKRS